MNSPIFTPIKINTLELPNRIVLPAMVTNFASRNGEVTDRLIRYHVERAAGGCGLNIVEAGYVHMSGRSFACGVSYDSDAMIAGLKRLTDGVHAVGGHIAAQLQHGGRMANPGFSGQQRLLVSQIPGITPDVESREMTEKDILMLIDAYAEAARRAKEAQFDVIELHGAHGYLIQQFFSPRTNLRNDKWGGSPENRIRFGLEVLKAVRKAVGKDFPVTCRLTVDEFIENGLTLDMTCEIAKALADNGIDAINVTVACPETNQFVTAPPCQPLGWNQDRAAAIKKAINGKVPVMVVGRIHDRASAEEILNSGKADMVVVGRGQIADPCFANKLKNGEDAAVTPCMSCNDGCIGYTAKGEGAGCAVNPRMGHELKYPMVPAKKAKKVLVIGAGPAGLEAAVTAFERGHKVILIEKNQQVGGLLNYAKLPPHKYMYARLIKYYEHRLANSTIDLRLGCGVTEQLVKEIAPDAIIAATGSLPIVPGFCRNVQGILSAQQILTEQAKAGENVIVLGGGLVGCETAEFLAEKGHKVTVLELRDSLAPDLDVRARRLLLPRLEKYGVKPLLQNEIVSISEDGKITVRDRFHNEKVLPAYDSIVLALGFRSDQSTHAMLESLGIPLKFVGDSIRASKVITASETGFEAAYSL